MIGTWMKSVRNEWFEAFIGIPFAKPPIGELRFANPVPNDRWAKKQLDATGRFPKPPCVQVDLFTNGIGVEGNEDCLYLNVYRPIPARKNPVTNNATASPKLPTVVYIHGGGYFSGTNSPLILGPEKLMVHPVILVTIAYRVGLLGFFSTGDEAASGNFGLKDQRLALRWVHRNIRIFGGDPRLVTIMGQSAGGSSVQLQMMHLGNEGLFQRAISLSGSALAPWSTPQGNLERLARLQATIAGIKDANTMSTNFGIVHSDDTIYIFRTPALFPDFQRGSPDAQASQRFTKFLVDFARTGVVRTKPTESGNNATKRDGFPLAIEFFNKENKQDPLVWSGELTDENLPRVCIEDGCMRGSWMRSVGGERFEAFFGIPFAKPPIGELRFANPVPNDRWAEDELDATGWFPKPPCVQVNLFIPGREVEGKEDCLYLNVYRPEKKHIEINGTAALKLPTVVYIHGGGYLAGYNSPLVAGAEKLMDHPVILVTIAYRLGAFGFLSTGDEAASGNFGLKDQRLALRWVHRNIRAFGGDPRLVTIMGHSAGGASVQLQMMHLANEGLFQRAISLSGSALAPWSMPPVNPEQVARLQAALVGIKNAKTMSTSKLVKALRTIDADRIASSITKLWSQGAYLPVPWLTGMLPNDGFIFSAPLLNLTTQTRLAKASLQLEAILLYALRGTNNPNALALLKERFFSNASSPGAYLTKENIESLAKLINEVDFYYPLILSVKQQLQYSKESRAPIYLYKFNYKGQFSYSSVYVTGDNTTLSRDFGIVHGDELIFIFRTPALFPDFQPGSPDAQVSQRLNKFLVYFARTGRLKRKSNLSGSTASKRDGFPLALEFFNNLINEVDFYYPLILSVKQQLQYSKESRAPIYLYKFNYKGQFSYSSVYVTGDNTTLSRDFGIVHGDELIFIFRTPALFPDFQPGSPDAQVSQRLNKFLVYFARVEGKEDCLYLNVFLPKAARKNRANYNTTASPKFPTVVYIHGIGFVGGYSSPLLYGPEKLMDEPVILVTFDYRMSAFGFLSTGDEAASGNFGLKDQRLALRWVHRNIRAFGGDPRLVTIMGYSAGGASAQLQMMHLANEGLFQRAISMSGSVLAPWSMPPVNPEQVARKQAALVGIKNAKTMSTSKLVKALRTIDADRLASSITGFTKLWSQGAYLPVSWLTGILPNDGLAFSAPLLNLTTQTRLAKASIQLETLIPYVLPLILLLSAGPIWADRLAAQNLPRVCIEDGCIRGSWMKSERGEWFEAFFGIPFAKPPIGELRFANPVPNDRWANELDATGRFPKPPCVQVNLLLPGRGVEGKEDCLYLNVFRPIAARRNHANYNATASPKLPTVVYIHGGGYFSGTNSPLIFGPEKLMDHPVILVTITYRVGVFGFLSTGDEAASGNFGLKDQRLALRWIHRNIRALGGDPRRLKRKSNLSGSTATKRDRFPLALEFFNKENQQDPLGLRHTNIYDKDIFNFWTRFYSS
uniref:Carboxylesterase type B domain-containing protein n=1 Tax=Anopheles atroparvus TaxID=41427 RepID=A0A182J5U2_ANOAO